jgi:hypothetical protein
MFTGNTSFAQNVRAHRVNEAIALVGAPPVVVLSGATRTMRVSWNGRGQYYENCDHVTDHGVLNAEEAVAFQTWCQVVYA